MSNNQDTLAADGMVYVPIHVQATNQNIMVAEQNIIAEEK